MSRFTEVSPSGACEADAGDVAEGVGAGDAFELVANGFLEGDGGEEGEEECEEEEEFFG